MVPPSDGRVVGIQKRVPHLSTVLRSFSDQFGNNREPSLLIVRDDAPSTVKSREALVAFRNAVALSYLLRGWQVTAIYPHQTPSCIPTISTFIQ
jgi:hypothetical protein